MSFNDKNGLVGYLATPEAQMRQMQELQQAHPYVQNAQA